MVGSAPDDDAPSAASDDDVTAGDPVSDGNATSDGPESAELSTASKSSDDIAAQTPPPSPADATGTVTLDAAPSSRPAATQEIDESWGDHDGREAPSSSDESGPLPVPPRPSLELGTRPPAPRPSSPGAGARPPNKAELGARPRPPRLEDSDDPLEEEELDTRTETRDNVLGNLTGQTNVLRRPDADMTATQAAQRSLSSAADLPTAPLRPTPAPAAIMPRPMPPAATADALHEEDEDGPTMVAAALTFPKSLPDDEATQIHPQRSDGQPASLTPSGGYVLPHPLAMTEQLEPTPMPVDFMSGVALAQREAAMNAALAAAQEKQSPEEVVARRQRHLELAVAAMLGVGVTLATFAAYLSASAIADGSPARGASYAALTVLAALALFAVGMVSLQKKENTRLALVIGAGLVLMFALTRLLVIALS